jgi:predicted SAM-dependent methyltransferase
VKQLFDLRNATKDKAQRNKIKDMCKSIDPVKLHIGSGRNYKEGWINIDVDESVKTDIHYDLSKGIPFPDNSADYIFNEHFIEHLSYEEGLEFMKES